MSTSPLLGLRIVDLADEKGELCGRLLSDLGAEVLRIEPPGGGISRGLPPFAEDGETSLYFGFRNAGKRGGTLDLERPEGRNQLVELLADADVLIESFEPGYLAGLGISPETLIKRHPHLIVTSISDFGQTGPYANYVGTDMVGVAIRQIAKPPIKPPKPAQYIEMARQSLDRQTAWSSPERNIPQQR